MPTRTQRCEDPEYVRRCERVFGAPPDQPFIELFIPSKYLTSEISDAVHMPVWQLERDVIWPEMARLLQHDGVRGSLLEFGVFGGGSLARLIQIFRPLEVIDRFYGFDSFKGIPKPDTERDHPYFWHEGAFANTSKDGVLGYLASGLGPLDDVELVEGWYSETLPAMRERISHVAFVRIDCDLYSSSVDVFSFVSGRLVDGAMLYFDDWTHEASTGETGAFFEFAEREAGRYAFERVLTVSDGAMAVRVRLR